MGYIHRSQGEYAQRLIRDHTGLLERQDLRWIEDWGSEERWICPATTLLEDKI